MKSIFIHFRFSQASLSLLLFAAVLIVGAQAKAATIAEGTAEIHVARVQDRHGDSALIDLDVGYRLWPLAGEPVKVCVAHWKINSVTIDSRQYLPRHIPDDILQQAVLYSAKARINLNAFDTSAAIAPSFICDLGVLGPPDGRTLSFNSPGSPSWDEFLLNGVIWDRNDPFDSNGLPEDQAKEYSRQAMLRYQSRKFNFASHRHVWGAELWEANINLWPIRRYLRDQGKLINPPGNRNSKNRGPDRNRTSGRAWDTPRDTPSRQDLLDRAGITGGSLSDQPIAKVLDELQRQTGSDSSLSSSKAIVKAPVSGATIPREPSSNDVSSSLLLVVDTSGSMGGEKMRDAKEAAKDVIDNALRQSTEVGVVGFSGDECADPVSLHHPFSEDAESLHRFVDSLPTDGGTPMSAAVEYANRYMAINRSPVAKNEMIILLADGEDSCEILSPVVSKLKSDGVFFRHQTVGLEVGSNSSASGDLKRLAKESGGDYQYAADSRQLNETFRRAMLAMQMLDMLGRFGEAKEKSSSGDRSESNSTQSILDGFDP